MQAAALDSRWHFVDFRGGQHKNSVLRRLLKRFQQRVKSIAAEAMHLVDDVDLEGAFARGKGDFVPKLAHVVHASVRGGVDFDQIQKTRLIDRNTIGASIAGAAAGVFMFAVDRLGQQARGGRLAGAAGSAEEVGVTHAPADQRIAQRAGDVLLPNHIVKDRGRHFRYSACSGTNAPPGFCRESSTCAQRIQAAALLARGKPGKMAEPANISITRLVNAAA